MKLEQSSRYWDAMAVLESADEIHSPVVCEQALHSLAQNITRDLSQMYPLVLSVMGGAVVFTGKLLPLLKFPLDFDYIHITRYGDRLKGGEFQWLREPSSVAGRDVLVLDDILDEGYTMQVIVEQIMGRGAKSCRCAVFANKVLPHEKAIVPDYIGLSVPNRFVFGYGMDVQNQWRNLDGIYAIAESA